MGINAERAAAMDFSAPYMEVEQGYLVRAGVSIATASDVDKAGIRIGVLEKSGADLYLSRTLKNATLVRVKSLPENLRPAGYRKGRRDCRNQNGPLHRGREPTGLASSRRSDPRRTDRHGRAQGAQRRRRCVRRQVRRRGESGGARQVRDRAGRVTRRRCRPTQMMLSNHGVDSDAREAGARHAAV